MKGLIVGNWKENGTKEMVTNWFSTFSTLNKLNDIEFVICPPYPFLLNTCNKQEVSCGVQDISKYNHGPATGEITALSVSGVAKYAIVGHSERRKILNESLEDIKEKIESLISAKITPIVCFENSKDIEVLKKYSNNCVFAIEPSENISSNGVFKKLDLDSIKQVAETAKVAFGVKIELLYGGSVNTGNVLEIRRLGIFSGVLVGKASLDPKEFFEIGRIWQND